MNGSPIFKTERLSVRLLRLTDLNPFHKMQSNPLVMQYATGKIKEIDAHLEELKRLILKYQNPNNNFWIYAIERKSDNKFIGTCALVKDGEDDEIGYRFLQEYWSNGYGNEICKGLVDFCKKKIGFKKLIAYAVDKNIASAKILKKLNFKEVKKFISDDIKLPETKYELML